MAKHACGLATAFGLLATCLHTPGAHAQPADTTQQTCVDVQVGSAQSYDCLNQKLKSATQSAQRYSSDSSAPYTANSPGNVTGQFNESATRNRLGSNYGKSVTPARPPVTYTNPVGPH
jgi:hypothetical protein